MPKPECAETVVILLLNSFQLKKPQLIGGKINNLFSISKGILNSATVSLQFLDK
jgi:hypothetical protein